MNNRYTKHSLQLLAGIFMLTLFIYSCASIGTPNGGPYDEKPPQYLSSIPVPNQTHFSGKRIEILFDELIQLEKPSENVIITPPQMELPIIRTSGRKVIVELKDSLQDNTTYTIDFTSSIVDNNEKNVLENFSFAFSTGEIIDTLEVSGQLLNAENLEPMPGITIGLHSNLEDSAFTQIPFVRTSRTNEKGGFTIRNISPGTYRIYALNDVNRDYKFDQPGEDIAFLDTLIIPAFEHTTRQDTIWADSVTIDTLRIIEYTRFYPDDINLLLFKEEFERQYMLRPERNRAEMFTLRFNAELDTIPLPVPLNFTPQDSSWYTIQVTEENAINFWLTDPSVWELDSLSIELTYPFTDDSLLTLRPQTDTLQLNLRKQNKPQPKKKKKKDEEEEIDFLFMNINASGTVNIYDTISVTFDEPVFDISHEMFFLNEKVDTLWVPVEFDFIQDSINTLRYFISRKWEYGQEFLLEIDSASIVNIYGKWNDAYSSTFKIKNREEYGHLFLNIEGVDTTAFAQLLNTNDEPVRTAKVIDGGALFMDLKPDKYYARLIVDTNGNGKWDTGNYAEKRQAEEVFYSPKMYEVMQNWEVEETWNVKETPLARQKPLEITKNKPKEATQKKRDYKNEGRQSSSRSSSGRSPGMPF